MEIAFQDVTKAVLIFKTLQVYTGDTNVENKEVPNHREEGETRRVGLLGRGRNKSNQDQYVQCRPIKIKRCSLIMPVQHKALAISQFEKNDVRLYVLPKLLTYIR